MRTSQFTVNDIGDPEPIIVHTVCRHVLVGEDSSVANWPTTDYRIKGTDNNSAMVQRPAGVLTEFSRQSNQSAYSPGDIIGYVETVSGSTTFLIIEQ